MGIAEFRKTWVANELPKYLKFISDIIEKNGGKWLVNGDNPTIADCKAVAMLRSFTKGHMDHINPKCLEINPVIVDYANVFVNWRVLRVVIRMELVLMLIRFFSLNFSVCLISFVIFEMTFL